jgi:hypothetical protein
MRNLDSSRCWQRKLCPCRARNTFFFITFNIAPLFCAFLIFCVDLDIEFQIICLLLFTVITEIRIYRQHSVQSPNIKSSEIPFSGETAWQSWRYRRRIFCNFPSRTSVTETFVEFCTDSVVFSNFLSFRKVHYLACSFQELHTVLE